jgi:ATP-dependent Clp protease ATP-binding subunit ClpA
MFERYTESARRALFFARYEVTARGATSIDTEHLLLGLLRQPKGLIARLFAESNVSPAALQEAIEAPLEVRERLSTSVEVPFSAETQRALQYAAEEADRLLHSYIGTEHLLLGLLREQGSIAASVLNRHGVRLEGAREAVVKLLRESPAAPDALEHRDHRELRLGDPLAVEAAERVASIRRLVHELGRKGPDDAEARDLMQQIEQSLDAVLRLFPR